MSARGIGAVAVQDSNYPTPRSCTVRLVEALDADGVLTEPRVLFGPTAGEGAILRDFDHPSIVRRRANEIRQSCLPSLERLCGVGNVRIGDALAGSLAWWRSATPPTAIVCDNPPFELMDALAERFAPICSGDVLALLCRCSWWCGAGRRGALLARLGVPDIYGIPERVSFVRTRYVDERGVRLASGGADSVGVCWYVWRGSPRTVGRVQLLRAELPEEKTRPPLRTLVVGADDFKARKKKALVLEERWSEF